MTGCFRLAVSLAIVCASCSKPAPEIAPTRGVFGVFFGGQVQELQELEVPPLGLTNLGFRLTFSAENAHDRRVHYEVVRPGSRGRRLTIADDFVVGAGETTFDRPIPIPPDAELGTWNVRVECDGVAVIDRAIRMRRGR